MSYNFVSYAFFVIYALEWQVKCHLANFWACCYFSLKFYYSLYISAVCFSIILFSMTRFALRCCFKLVLSFPKRLCPHIYRSKSFTWNLTNAFASILLYRIQPNQALPGRSKTCHRWIMKSSWRERDLRGSWGVTDDSTTNSSDDIFEAGDFTLYLTDTDI